MTSNYKIDGITIKRPSEFRIEEYDVTTLKRLASADMAGDLIKTKLKFYFTYDCLTSKDWAIIKGALASTTTLFHTLTYIDDNVECQKTIYKGAIPRTLQRTGNVWVWKDISFSLIER